MESCVMYDISLGGQAGTAGRPRQEECSGTTSHMMAHVVPAPSTLATFCGQAQPRPSATGKRVPRPAAAA